MPCITVDYIRAEYLRILEEFAPINSYREKHDALPCSAPEINFWDKAVVYALGTIMFTIKVRKVGQCTFVISTSGFQRNSSVGEKFIEWNEVIHIHLLSCAYLIELKEGFIPLPFRCFSESQRIEFDEIRAKLLLDSKFKKTAEVDR